MVKGTVGQRETMTGVCFFDGLSTKVGLGSLDKVGKHRDEIRFVESLQI